MVMGTGGQGAEDPWLGLLSGPSRPAPWDPAVLAMISLLLLSLLYELLCGLQIKRCSFNFLIIVPGNRLQINSPPTCLFTVNLNPQLAEFPIQAFWRCLFSLLTQIREVAATPFSRRQHSCYLPRQSFPPNLPLLVRFLLKSLILVSHPLFLSLSFMDIFFPHLC